jgi:hypothetical protein
MKNEKMGQRNSFAVLIVVCSLLFVFGCSNALLEKGGEGVSADLSAGYGAVAVNLAAGTARTVMPVVGLESLTLEYWFAKNGEAAQKKEPDGSRFILETGVYTLTVKGFVRANDPDALAAQGEASFTIASGTVAETVNLVLRPLASEGEGSLEFGLRYPADARVEVLALTLIAGGSSFDLLDLDISSQGSDPVALSGTKTGIPAGYYLLQVRLKNGEGGVAGKSEVVHIYRNLTAKTALAAYTFTAGDFKAPEKLPTPGNIRILADNQTLLVLWDPVPAADSYEARYSRLHDAPEQAEGSRNSNAARLELTGLANGANYRIWIRAKNTAGASSDFSAEAQGTPAEPSGPPAVPAPALETAPESLKVGWPAAASATDYEVRWTTGPLPEYAGSKNIALTGGEPSWTITGLANFTSYNVWVRSKNSKGFSAYSETLSGTPGLDGGGNAVVPAGTPPKPQVESAPGELRVVIAGAAGALGYEIWRGDFADVALAHKDGELTEPGEIVLQGLGGGAWYVWVRARNAAGFSPWSEAASATADAPAAPGTPAAPVLTPGNNAVGATWASVAGAALYDIFYREAGASPGLYSKAGSSASGTYTLNGVNNGSAWEFALAARNASGPGALGPSSTITLPPSAPRPLRVTATHAKPGTLTASWDAVSGATGYRIYWAESNDIAAAALAGTYAAPAETDLALPAGKRYYLWIRAFNAGGDSPLSGATERILPTDFFQSLADLASWLGGSAANTLATPYVLALRGVNLGRGSGGDAGDALRILYNTFQGRYLALDLDACTGATIGFGSAYGQSSAGRPDKDRLVAVVLPSETTRVGFVNFQNCVNLESVEFPPGLHSVGDNAFNGCASLQSADLPASLRSIGTGGFSGCSGLQRLTVRAATPPALGSNAFSGCPAALPILVPAAGVEAYKTAAGWSERAAYIAALEE